MHTHTTDKQYDNYYLTTISVTIHPKVDISAEKRTSNADDFTFWACYQIILWWLSVAAVADPSPACYRPSPRGQASQVRCGRQQPDTRHRDRTWRHHRMVLLLTVTHHTLKLCCCCCSCSCTVRTDNGISPEAHLVRSRNIVNGEQQQSPTTSSLNCFWSFFVAYVCYAFCLRLWI